MMVIIAWWQKKWAIIGDGDYGIGGIGFYQIGGFEGGEESGHVLFENDTWFSDFIFPDRVYFVVRIYDQPSRAGCFL